jgi:iduronate 2-sulfatase
MTTRRAFLRSLPGAALLKGAHRRNVLFIVADDLNNDLGCYGHPVVRSPHIDALARRGVVFERAYCQFPLCQPSRVSFLSGRYPETTKVWSLDTPTRQFLGDTILLPEHFRREGYFTAHAGKIFHTGEHAEDARSWDEELREFDKSPPKEAVLESGTAAGPGGHTFEWAVLRSKDEETPDGLVARKAVDWMEKAARAGKSFFVGAGFRRPHAPYAAPKKYFDQYVLERIPLPATPAEHLSRLLPAAINLDPPPRPLPPEEVRRFRLAYWASVSFMDAQVGVLLEGLTRLRLWESTVVVFLSDNGYHLGDHGGLWHKNTLFEESARIPLIVYAPGMPGNGRRSQALVELVDLYPSLAELCALPPPEGVEGLSLAPLLKDPSRPWKKGAFTVASRGEKRKSDPSPVAYLGRSVRTERWRYNEWDEGRRGAELYDHRTDPGELRNLAEDPGHASVREWLHRLLRAGWKAARPA